MENKNNYPNFEKLLLILSKNIDSDGRTLNLQQRSDEALKILKEKREVYLKKKILYNQIISSFLERKKNLMMGSETEDTIWDMFMKSMLFDLFDELDDNLLGLNKHSFTISSEHKKFMTSIKSKLLKRVECGMQESSDELIDVYNELSNEPKRAIHCNLPSLLASQQVELNQLKKNLQLQKIAREQIFSEYSQCLKCSCDTLVDLIKTYRLDKLLHSNTITLQLMLYHCEALCLKIKMQELHLLSETYSKDSVKALNIIKKELYKRDAQTSVELSQKVSLLSTYESVGHEFKSIVEEFSRVKDEIENKKWALEEVEKHKK